MGLFSSTPEQRATKERQQAESLKRQQEAVFAASPPGQARAAKAAGATLFQIDIPLSRTTGSTVAMVGAFANTTATGDFSRTIQAIENEGWHLEHAGYVYRVTGSVSRDKFLASGQQEAVHGEIVGIYIFRAT
jgi:hypothetical protein